MDPPHPTATCPATCPATADTSAMLCVGSRDKSGTPSSAQPVDVREATCDVDSITLVYALNCTRGPPRVADLTCCVQCLEVGTFTSSWTLVKDASWQPKERPPEASEDPSEITCTAVVKGLAAETGYTFRILARGTEWEQFAPSASVACRTAERPRGEIGCLACSARSDHGVEVCLDLPDPRGAPVLECEAHFRADGLMSSWQVAERGGAFECVERGAADRGGRLWRGHLTNLRAATCYRLRARARNAVGWSEGWTPELVCWTSDVPLAPRDLQSAVRHPTSVCIRFVVDDPEGAPVEACSVELQGLLGYSAHSVFQFDLPAAQVDGEGRHPKASRTAMCTVEGLAPETEYWLRLFVSNAGGASRNPSSPLRVVTSERPRPPARLRAQVGPQAVQVEWDLADPEGAPVLAAEVEYCRDSFLASWEKASVEPVALILEDGPVYDAAAMEKALAASELTAEAVVRRWRVKLQNLDLKTGYLLRARVQNCVGWSTEYSPTLVAKTSDRPPSPQNLRCTARLPGAVQLECSVAEVLGTASVSCLTVELSGSFSWHDATEVEVRKAERQEEGMSNWVVLVNLGITPGVVHKLRVWASNSLGRCSEPSAVCVCRTSDRPGPPAAVRLANRFPYTLGLEWALRDPEGAPVKRFEVQCRRDVPFASWQLAPSGDATRQPPALAVAAKAAPAEMAEVAEATQVTVALGRSELPQWRCMVEQLEPAATYHLCVRAWNEAGWSEWRIVEGEFRTSLSPCEAGSIRVRRGQRLSSPVSKHTQGVASGGAAGDGAARECAEGEGGMKAADAEDGLLVDVSLADPEGAPVISCMVASMEHGGCWLMARRAGHRRQPGQWRVFLPTLDARSDFCLAGARLNIRVRAVNAVGWWSQTTICEVGEAQASDAGSANDFCDAAVELVAQEVRNSLREQQAAQERFDSLLKEARERADQEHTELLSRHSQEVNQRMDVLREVAQQMDIMVEDRGEELVGQLQAAMEKQTLLPDTPAAAKVLSLLLRGYTWLDRAMRPELRRLTEGITKKAPTKASGVLAEWARQSGAWSESFDEKVSGALPEGLATAAQLLATLVSGRRLELFKTVKSDVAECCTLVSAAERQLKRLRQSHRMLNFAEATTSHDFEQKGVLRKIETTALGIVTMLVLPVPGSIETGAIGIGMLWLEGDETGSHLALEHPTGAPLGPMLQRLGSSPPPRAAVIIAGWASGGHRGVVLVHNATARRITVSVTEASTSLSSKAYTKLSEAHPMVRGLAAAMAQSDGGDHVVTILPTDVALLQVPHADGDAGEAQPVQLEFCYGPAGHPEKAMGRSSVKPGTAISFTHLDGALQVSNSDGDGADEPTPRDAITVVNNDLTPVIINVFRAPEAQKHFESALFTATLQSGEQRHLQLPRPCVGRIFQLEVVHARSKKVLCEARPGQRVTTEGCF